MLNFDPRYLFLAIVSFAVLFQFLKFRNSINVKYVNYLNYFNELALVSRDSASLENKLRILVGFESVNYKIYKKLKIFNMEKISSTLCFRTISNEEDLQCALFKAKKNDLNFRYHVNNETLLKEILSDVDNVYTERIGGSGVHFARNLARSSVQSEILFLGRMSEHSASMLPRNIRVFSKIDNRRNVGLKRQGIIFFVSENQRAMFDTTTLRNSLDEMDLFSQPIVEQFKPHAVVVGRISAARSSFSRAAEDRLQHFGSQLRLVPAGVVVHHQMGSIDTLAMGKAMMQHIVPYLDSLDVSLTDLHRLHCMLHTGKLELPSNDGGLPSNADQFQYSADVASTLDLVDHVWQLLHEAASVSSLPGARKLARLHVRAADFHLLLVARQSSLFYMNSRHALAKALMARLRSRCGNKYSRLRQTIHFHLEDDFFSLPGGGGDGASRNNNNSSETRSPIDCWSPVQHGFDICVAAVPTCINLKYPIDEAETSAATALAAQIKVIV